MALSELKVMDLWAQVLTGYKSLGERIFKFAQSIEAEVRRQDEALIRQMLEALEQSHATLFEEDDDPERPAHAAIAAARARLLEADLAKLTERGAVAWKGIDPQDLRDGGKQ